MEGDFWPHGSCDGAGRNLARLRNRASQFFESLSVAELVRDAHRQLWVADWLRVADDYRAFAETARGNGSVRIAREAWLCSLTAIEVARTLSCPVDLASTDLADRVDASLKGLGDDSAFGMERVEIDGFEQGPLSGCFLQALGEGPSAPAILCIGDEDITPDSMMSRLLPVSLRRTASLLLVGAGHSSVRRRFKPEHVLQCWLDYLQARPDVDPQRIAIYGEGTGANHASRLALSNRGIAAAVCDGGLLTPVMRRASFRWITGFEQDELPSLPSRRINCPLLMVVGSRSMVREHEALELQAHYRQAEADSATVVPNRIPHPLGEVENFIAVDDFIFDWLDSKLGTTRQIEPVTYL